MAFGISAGVAALVASPLLISRKAGQRYGKLLLMLNLFLFSLAVVSVLVTCLSGYLLAGESETTVATAAESNSNAWAFISAALATGIGSIGAGIAVAAAAPAAIGALAENENNFGKAMIFVGLGEGLAIFGLLVSILILQKVP